MYKLKGENCHSAARQKKCVRGACVCVCLVYVKTQTEKAMKRALNSMESFPKRTNEMNFAVDASNEKKNCTSSSRWDNENEPDIV